MIGDILMPNKKQNPSTRAKLKYNTANYDRLYPYVPKGYKAEIQAAADAVGETLNEYIVNAIDRRMEQDKK